MLENISFLSLPPTSQLTTAPTSGAKMIKLKRLFSIIDQFLRMLAVSTSIDRRLRKKAMNMPSPTAASAAATLITIKTKSWPWTSA
jgi:hypothetical protein